MQMYCHLIVPLNRSAEQCAALSQTLVNEWLEVLAGEPDEITSADPTQGIVLLTKKTGRQQFHDRDMKPGNEWT